MKKLLAMVLAAVLLLSFSGIALATQVHSIGTDLDMQSVSKNLPITVKIHPTIAMNTFDKETGDQKDVINIPCLNPKTNWLGKDGVDWVVWSNLPFHKTASWTDLKTSWNAGTVAEPKMIEDVITADRVVVKVEGVPIPNPWTSPIIGYPAEQHQEKENVMVQLEINWCDSAGIYTGSLTLDAHQN